MDMTKVKALSKKYETDMAQFLRDIIAIPSESCKEKEVVHRIAEEMRKCGFDEVKFDKLGNVLGRMGSGKTVIMYDAHIDVVGVGDPASWKRDPWKGEFKDGKIWGRGAVDEKPAMSCMIYGAKVMKELNMLGDYTLWVVGSVMEEDCDGYPLIHIIEKENIKPDFVVLGEPTDMAIFRGHRGRMEIRVITKGVSAHGAHCDKGINAIYKMAPIIQDIEQLNKKLKHDDFLGKGTITVAFTEAKSPSLCSVPNECTIYLDRRLTAGETMESAVNEIKSLPHIGDAIVEVLQYDAISWTGYNAKQEKYFPTWVLPENHKIVQAGAKSIEAVLGKKAVISRWTFSTNGVATMGRFNIPTIGFAPGREELAHSTEEYVEVKELVEATEFYAIFPQELMK